MHKAFFTQRGAYRRLWSRRIVYLSGLGCLLTIHRDLPTVLTYSSVHRISWMTTWCHWITCENHSHVVTISMYFRLPYLRGHKFNFNEMWHLQAIIDGILIDFLELYRRPLCCSLRNAAFLCLLSSKSCERLKWCGSYRDMRPHEIGTSHEVLFNIECFSMQNYVDSRWPCHLRELVL